MKKKVFWISFVMLGLVADISLPFVWAMAATVPILIIVWWFAYKTDWFE